MTNGWTGGQYSLYRVIFGTYLLAHFIALFPWATELFSNRGVLPAAASPLLHLFPNILAANDSPAAVAVVLAVGAVASILFAIGLFSRSAAITIWYVLACLFGRDPLISNPSLPFVGWLLLAHTLVPRSPYGAWSARRSLDPRGGWMMPTSVLLAAWIVMSVAYSYSGYEKLISPSWVNGTALARVLMNPLARPTVLREGLLRLPELAMRLATWGALLLELLFAPLALFRVVRPWLWTAMLGMHFGLLLLINFAELSLGMMILHLFTFDPAWLPGKWRSREDLILFDGTCGLCHQWTRFVLSEDRTGVAFQFAPLQGETYAALNSGTQIEESPGSIVVETANGESLVRADAIMYILTRLGGLWRVTAAAMKIFPRSVRNKVYDCVARNRHSVFPSAKTLCPIVPADLRSRFRD